MVTTQSLVLTNTGAHEAVFEIGEIAGQGPIIDADVELILDDGSAEDGIGIGGTLEFIFLNKFTPDPELFPFNLEQVQSTGTHPVQSKLVMNSRSPSTRMSAVRMIRLWAQNCSTNSR